MACRVVLGFFAKRDIQAGEELAYDYNFEHSGLAEQAGAYRLSALNPKSLYNSQTVVLFQSTSCNILIRSEFMACTAMNLPASG